MILVLTLLYIAVLAIAVKFKLIKLNLFWKLSPLLWMIILLIGLFVPMQFWAPGGYIRVMQPTVQIVPNVAGEVIEVMVKPNTNVHKDDILFQIDPLPFQAVVDRYESDLEIAKIRVKQQKSLMRKGAGKQADLDRAIAKLKTAKAQLAGAKYNLAETTVRAPADGFITNSSALKIGARVVTAPLRQTMTLVDSERIVVAQIQQSYMRYLEPGQKAEVALKMYPGQVFTATIHSMYPGSALGQVGPTGQLSSALQEVHGPVFVRLELDDKDIANTLPAGSSGEVAIYTPRGGATHVIRKVMIRMTSIMNYINPY